MSSSSKIHIQVQTLSKSRCAPVRGVEAHSSSFDGRGVILTRHCLGTTRQLRSASWDFTGIEVTGKSIWPSWSMTTFYHPASPPWELEPCRQYGWRVGKDLLLRSEEGWGLSYSKDPAWKFGSHPQLSFSVGPSPTKPSQAPNSHSAPAKHRHKQVFTAVDKSAAFASTGSQGSPRAPALFAVKEGLSQ